MLNFYNYNDRIVTECEKPIKNCLINLHNPTNDEINFIGSLIGITSNTITRMLDSEERSRIDLRDDYTLSVINVPFVNKNNIIDVTPIGILISKDYFLLVSTESVDPLNYFNLIDNKIDLINNKINVFIAIFYEIAKSYVKHTRKIIKDFEVLEEKLINSNNNSDMIKALNLQKILTFFSMSLYSNDLVITRITKLIEKNFNSFLNFSGINDELLDDTYTENKQAIEMVDTYSKITIDLMNTISSMVSNNQNNFLKLLTNITFMLTIPMVLAGFWGMNVKIPFEGQEIGFWIITGISIILMLLSLFYLWKKNLLK